MYATIESVLLFAFMDSFDPLVTIRTATPDEYERVVELSKNMHHAKVPALESSLWDEDPIAWIGEECKKGNAEVSVAYDSATQNIVASGIGIIYEAPSSSYDELNDKIGYIRWMSTAEDFRGYGVGEQILNHLMKWFEEKNTSRVELHATDKATEFYSQHGFQQDEETDMWWKSTKS